MYTCIIISNLCIRAIKSEEVRWSEKWKLEKKSKSWYLGSLELAVTISSQWFYSSYQFILRDNQESCSFFTAVHSAKRELETDSFWSFALWFTGNLMIKLVIPILLSTPFLFEPRSFRFLQIVTVSFCLLLSVFYLSAVIDPSSYAAEQIEILLAGKVQYFADLLNTTPQTGRRFASCAWLNRAF